MELGGDDKARYLRQIILPEIGSAGQARLLASSCRIHDLADPAAAAVAVDYLQRAGLRATPGADSHSVSVEAPLPDVLASLAEYPHALAAVTGAFAAVEAIKQVLQVGRPARTEAS